METQQQQKDLHPFISTIMSNMEGNLEFEEAVHNTPQVHSVFVDRDMHYVPIVLRYMYNARIECGVTLHRNGMTLAELVGPIMFNPAFILQIIAQTGGDPEMGHGGKGNIWQWAGVQQHADFNGQLRPAISWTSNQ